MRIGVIGAGIAGLVTAVCLQQDGHDVVVYEQRDNPNAQGAGLTLFGNSLAALDAVKLGDAVRDLAFTALHEFTTGQRTPNGRWLMTMPQASVDQLYSLDRRELHAYLLQTLAPGTVRTDTTALVSSDGRPQIQLTAAAIDVDLVVVADGVRSRNRARLGLDPGIRYAGFTAWRGVTQRFVDIDGEAAETWGSGRIFGYVPLPRDRLYWFGTRSVPQDTTWEDPYAAAGVTFSGWHDPIGDILAATPPGEVLHHDVYDLRKPLRTFTRGRTVVIGDAAHAMLPNLGQGAGQGIEDAVTLALLLRTATTASVESLLSQFTTLRRHRTAMLWQQSRLMARIAHAAHPMTVRLRNTAMRWTPSGLVAPMTRRLHTWQPPSGMGPATP